MARLGPLLETRTPGSSGKGNGLLAGADGRRLVSMGSDGVGRFLYSLGKVGYLYVPLVVETIADGYIERDVRKGTEEQDNTTKRDSGRCDFHFYGSDESANKDVGYPTVKQQALASLDAFLAMLSGTEKPKAGAVLSGGRVTDKSAGTQPNLYGGAISDIQGTWVGEFSASFAKYASVFGDSASKGSHYTTSLENSIRAYLGFFLFASCAEGCRVSIPVHLRIGISAEQQASDDGFAGIAVACQSVSLKAYAVSGTWDNMCDNPISVGATQTLSLPVGISHPATAGSRLTYYERDVTFAVTVPASRMVALAWDEDATMAPIRAALDAASGYETTDYDGDKYYTMNATTRLSISLIGATQGVVHPIA